MQERLGTEIPDGEIEISGRDLFVRVASYETGPSSEKRFEAHQIYADLQLVIQGKERMDVSVEGHPRAVTDYDFKADISFFEDPKKESSICVSAAQFAFFFPGELHKPGCHIANTSEKVKKLVFKIKMA